MRGSDALFSDVAESYLRSKHKLRPWTKRSYAKSFARLGRECPTIGDLTLDFVNAYLTERIDAGHATIAHHDGGAAKRLAAWTVTARILPENPLAALSVQSSRSAGASHSPTSRPARSSRPPAPHATPSGT